MIEKSGVDVILGDFTGVNTTEDNQVTGVTSTYIDRDTKEDEADVKLFVAQS